MIVPVPINITIWQGKPWDMSFTWNLNGAPADLTGHGGRMSLVSTKSGSVPFVLASVANGLVVLTNPGLIRIFLAPIHTGVLEVGMCEWDYDDLDSFGSPLGQVASGKARVRRDV